MYYRASCHPSKRHQNVPTSLKMTTRGWSHKARHHEREGDIIQDCGEQLHPCM